MSRDEIIKACHDVVLHYWRTPNRDTLYYEQFNVLTRLPDSYKRDYELTELVARESRGEPTKLTNAELFDEIALWLNPISPRPAPDRSPPDCCGPADQL